MENIDMELKKHTERCEEELREMKKRAEQNRILGYLSLAFSVGLMLVSVIQIILLTFSFILD